MTKKKFRVIDIPAGTTAEQAEQLINGVCEEVVAWASGMMACIT